MNSYHPSIENTGAMSGIFASENAPALSHFYLDVHTGRQCKIS